tara:strand:+ start:116 stop:334 length:219 start_codon:yes stop_codon:yes gene_type:complete
MASTSGYIYRERSIFDVQTLLKAFRFIIINAILAFIFLFLTLEEIDWAIFSAREKHLNVITDTTSWNIKTIF